MSQPTDAPSDLSARPNAERHYKEALRSAAWDIGDGRAPRLQYVVLSLPRTGSEFLCASLRRRGIGVPMEYLGMAMTSIAKRLGCMDEAGGTSLLPYFAQLHAKRTTPNGIFGIKVHPLHLKSFAREDIGAAAEFLNVFDRVLVLRRRDRLLQVISLVRAHLTEQFHILADDSERRVTQPDHILFGLIATHLANILKDERYVARVIAPLAPEKVTELWYEDLSDGAVEALGTALAAAAGDSRAVPRLDADHAIPRRGDPEEALDLKRRFLAYIAGDQRSNLS